MTLGWSLTLLCLSALNCANGAILYLPQISAICADKCCIHILILVRRGYPTAGMVSESGRRDKKRAEEEDHIRGVDAGE